MQSFANSRLGMILSVVVLAGIAIAVFPLLSSDGLVTRIISLDFSNIAPWIAMGAILLSLSRAAAIICQVLEARLTRNSSEVDEPDQWSYEDEQGDSQVVDGESNEASSSSPPLKTTRIAQGALQGVGWAVIASGLLMAVASIPAALSVRPNGPDTETLYRYLGIFASLIKWVVVAGIFFGLLPVAKVQWPAASDALPYPWRPLIALAVAYILLAGDGVLEVAFNFPGGLVLIILALALAVPYLASVLRQVVGLSLPERVQTPVRVLLLVIDIAWIVLVLGIMLSLPGIVGDIPELQPGGALSSIAPYLDIFDTLAFWSIILLSPFIIVRAIAAFRPVVGEVFGFPVGRMILFALALVGFSGNGIPATASSFPIPNLMPAMAAALVISYLTLILRRVAQLGLPPRIAVPMANIPPLIGALMPAISASLVVWALLLSSPLISAPLLDNAATSGVGTTSLPYFAGLFEVRFSLTSFVFVTVLTWSLPDPLWTPARLRVRPMVAAVGFTAGGCLLWLAMAPLSGVGHIFPLLGAIIGAGLLTLGLSQLAGYYMDSPEPLYSGPARWFISSKVRGLIVGAAIAFYGMLLRPLVYETFWFAAVYEWIVVFAVAVWAMFKIRGSLKSFVETAEAAPLNWTGWNRHQQQFEERPDPRRVLMSRWQHRFVESGEWFSLWSYQMGLLSRNNASPQSVQAVFGPLREAVSPQPGGGFLRRRGDKDFRRRETGLAASLRSTEEALSNSAGLPAIVDASAVRQASGTFIETGTDSEAMAATIISAYRRRGADTNTVITLWFPIVNVVNTPSKWFHPPWVRNRTRRRAQERRRRLVEGAISHLSGESIVASLTVGVAARRVPFTPVESNRGRLEAVAVSPPSTQNTGGSASSEDAGTQATAEQSPTPSRFVRHQMERASNQTARQGVSTAPRLDAITQGQGFELINETNSSYLVRTSENHVGLVPKSALQWLPILPGDEVVSD